MPDISDEYLEFMRNQQSAEPSAVDADAPAQDWHLGPVVPGYVFNGDPEKGIEADPHYAIYAGLELNRLEHCMFYYSGAGPENPLWPRPTINFLPESSADRWDYATIPPATELYWRWVNCWRRIRVRIIESLPDPLRRYIY